MNKRYLSILMATVCLLGVASSCGKKEKAEHEFEIQYYRAGMGINWLNEMKKSFEAENPGYIVRIADQTTDVGNNLDAGGNIITGDLFIGNIGFFLDYIDYLEPLDSLLDTTIEEENVTIRSKMYPEVMEGLKYNGKTYAMNWTNVPCGMFYNKSVFDSMNYLLPRTSDEFVELAFTIRSDVNQDKLNINGEQIKGLRGEIIKPAPFIHDYNESGYWTYVLEPWQAQYDGLETYVRSSQATYLDPNDGKEYFPSINSCFTQGKYESISALEKLIAPDGNTYYRSNSLSHTEAQTFFLNGYSIMIPCGGWLENEMRSVGSKYEISMMKMPVLSAVGTKLGVGDELLREIVSYVDSQDYLDKIVNNNSSEYSADAINQVKGYTKDNHLDVKGNGISGDEIIDEIYLCRNICYNNAPGTKLVVPVYSKRKEEVKKFLQFMYSDKGLKIIAEQTLTPPPATPTDDNLIDYSKWSEIGKKVVAATKGTQIMYVYNNKFFHGSGFIGGTTKENIPRRLTDINKENRLTTNEIWDKEKNFYETKWEDACSLSNTNFIESQSIVNVPFYGNENREKA